MSWVASRTGCVAECCAVPRSVYAFSFSTCAARVEAGAAWSPGAGMGVGRQNGHSACQNRCASDTMRDERYASRCEWRRVSARRCGGTVYATVSKTVALHGLVGSNPTTGTTAFIRLRAIPRLFLTLTELPLRQHISQPMPQTSLIACAYHYHSSAAYAWAKYSPTTL